MVVYVTLVQFAGVFLVFMIFPVYLIPFLEERFQVRLPRAAPAGLTGHVVVWRHGPAVSSLVVQASAAGVPALVVEPDEAVARRLVDRGQPVVAVGLEDDGLAAAGLGRARALIANGGDDENAAVILAARQAGFTGDAFALVAEPAHRKPMMLAGATAVFTPRHILAAALAARTTPRLAPGVAGIQPLGRLGRRLEIGEVRIVAGGPLAGRTLGESAIGTRTGASVIGLWEAGRLVTPPTAATRLAAGAVAVVAGSRASLGRLAELAGTRAALPREGEIVVGGYGVVGSKVVELLRDAGERVLVLDRRDGPGVDLAGDVLDAALLERAGVSGAQAVVLALDADAPTLFATVIVRDLAPAVPIIARVNRSENVERIHRAGADFALSISQVSGQMLARRLLGEETVAIDPQLKVRKVAADGLAGHHPAGLRLRERSGCTVVAVERGEEILVEFDPQFRFTPADTVYLCGGSAAVDRFRWPAGGG